MGPSMELPATPTPAEPARHTPTPWIIHPDNSTAISHAQSAKDRWTPETLARAVSTEDAALIVRCTNNHELMLRALEYALERYPKLAGSLVEFAITEAKK